MAPGDLGSSSVVEEQILLPLEKKPEEVSEVGTQEERCDDGLKRQVKSDWKIGENDYDGDNDDDDDDDFDDGEYDEEEDSSVVSLDCGNDQGVDLKAREEEEEEEESSDVAAERLRRKIGDHDISFLPSDNEDGKIDHITWIRYWKQVSRSKGFDIQDFPGFCEMTGVAPVWEFWKHTDLHRQLCELAIMAIESYNSKWGKDYMFKKIVSVNALLLCGIMYYITFEASSGNDAVVTFQAKCFMGLKKPHLKFCRRKRFTNKAAQ